MSNFLNTVKIHSEKYPKMMPQDYMKLAYQSEFGPEHIISSKESVYINIVRELNELKSNAYPQNCENISSDIVRFPLSLLPEKYGAEVLASAMVLTTKSHEGSIDGLNSKISELRTLNNSELNVALDGWIESGCRPVHHSADFRSAYSPSYRLVKAEYAPYIIPAAKLLALSEHKRIIVAIDGRCGSGKTCFAEFLSQISDCNIVHMDDFYLPIEKRAKNWMDIPAGNIDIKRLRKEILEPMQRGTAVEYRSYNCMKNSWSNTCILPPKKINILEGSYTHHPDLTSFYTLKIFLTLSKPEQKKRLQKREGSYYSQFESTWIPCEERYFTAFSIEGSADITIATDMN